MIKETEIIDIIKNYVGYTDRSMTEQCLHEVNFNLVAKDIVEKLTIPNVMVSDLVKVENAYIEDATFVGSYDVTGRVEQLWITKEDFNKIKCISN